MQITEIQIDKIRVEGRAREDYGDLDAFAHQEIEPYGLIQPISIDQNNKLLAGGRRLAAVKLLGWETIPAVIHNIKTKVSAKEIELLENTARKDMTWVERANLEREIYELKKESDPKWTYQDQEELTGSSDSAISRRIQLAEAIETIPELAEYESESDAFKELKKLEESFIAKELDRRAPPEILEASKWASDHYNVGDAFDGMARCRENLVDFAEVDPPYGVELDRRKSRNKAKNMTAYNEVDEDEYAEFFKITAREVYRILKPDSFAVFWFGPTWWSETRDALREAGFGVADIAAIWYKGTVGQTASPDTTFGSCYEPFWLARKGKPKLTKPGHDNVFAYNKVPFVHKIHPTEKPLELMQDIVQTCCFGGSTILCPFLGSGVTLRAAYSLGHTGFGWDLSQQNKDLFLRKVRGELIQDALESTDDNG